jgi:hypothetical protein
VTRNQATVTRAMVGIGGAVLRRQNLALQTLAERVEEQIGDRRL